MFDCHQTEKSFWKTMNPARLHALFHAYFDGRSTQAPQSSPAARQRDEPRSLSEYLMGGGR